MDQGILTSLKTHEKLKSAVPSSYLCQNPLGWTLQSAISYLFFAIQSRLIDLVTTFCKLEFQKYQLSSDCTLNDGFRSYLSGQ